MCRWTYWRLFLCSQTVQYIDPICTSRSTHTKFETVTWPMDSTYFNDFMYWIHVYVFTMNFVSCHKYWPICEWTQLQPMRCTCHFFSNEYQVKIGSDGRTRLKFWFCFFRVSGFRLQTWSLKHFRFATTLLILNMFVVMNTKWNVAVLWTWEWAQINNYWSSSNFASSL